MTFTYIRDIPESSHNPSTDQPDMKTNTNAVDDIFEVDHLSFNAANGGNHSQVHFPSFQNPSVVNGSAAEGSVIYGAAGTADTSHAQLLFKNASNTFAVSTLRAIGVLTTVATNGAVSLDMGFNVGSIISSSNGQIYTIAITAGATTGTTVIVFLNLSNNGTNTWSFAANTLTVSINAGSTGGQKLSFAIYQL